MKRKCPITAQLVIPASFAECVTYEKQILWLKKEIENLSVGGDPAVIDELRNDISMLENEFDSLQDELNSFNISAIQESIEQMFSVINDLSNSLANKQDKLTFDTVPTSGSSNPVTSDGVQQAIHDEGMRVEQLVNTKVSEDTFNMAIQNITNNYDTSDDVNLKLQGYATKTDISDMATKTELSDYVKNESLTDYATKQELNTYATKEELSEYVTEEELDTYVTEDDLTGYVTDTELEQVTSALATKEELNSKQDTLQFDATPREGSSNPVTSDGIYNALQSVTPVGITDDYVTAESDNPVKSSGIYQFVQDEVSGLVSEDELSDYATKVELVDYATKLELADYATKVELADYATDEQLNQAVSNLATKDELNSKQDTLQFDTTPTAGSTNPVTSDGIKSAIDAVVTTPIEVDQTVSQSSYNPVASSGIYNFVLDQMGDLVTTDQLATKQDKLTFDNAPAAGSNNPVTSNGIYTAISTATQDVVRTNQLSDYATNTSVDNKLTNYATKSELNNYATKDELMDYATQDDITGIEQQLGNYATTASVSLALANKQDVLTFDEVPMANSQNPVRSDGIYSAIQNASGGLKSVERLDLEEAFMPYLHLNKYNTTTRIDTSSYVENLNKSLKVFVMDDGQPAIDAGGSYFKPDVKIIIEMDFEGDYINTTGLNPGVFGICNYGWFELADCHLWLEAVATRINPSIIEYESGEDVGVLYNQNSMAWSTSSGGVNTYYGGANGQVPYLSQGEHFKYHVTWVRYGHFMSTNEFNLTPSTE